MTDPRFYPTPVPISLRKIADLFGACCHDENKSIQGINTLEDATADEIAACFDKKSIPLLQLTQAGACFVNTETMPYVPKGTIALEVINPRAAFAKLGYLFYPNVRYPHTEEGRSQSDIHPSASIGLNVFIGRGVEIGENTIVASGSYIGVGVKIGRNCRIYDNVTLIKTIVGNDASIHSGCRIGSEGFGFLHDGSELIDIPHLGRVLVKDNVRIGANTTIDRGVLGDTVIGDCCRIDNLVQIAHNVHLGRGCVIVSQVGIAGSTHIGDFSVLAGQVGIAGHLKIGRQVTVAAQSGVTKDIQDGEKMAGSPAVPLRQWHRQVLYVSKAIKK